MQQKASDDEDACPDLQLRSSVRLAALRFVVAFWARHLVGDGEPKRQDNVEQKHAQQDDFKRFDDVVGAHEIAKSIVPFTAVVAKDAEVGAGVEQQEDAQEGTK